MYKKGIIVKIEGQQATILPFVKDACASCSHNCNERGAPYIAENKQSLPIKEGMVVGISAEKKAEALQGIVSLLLPFFVAIAGFTFSAKIAGLLGLAATEGFKALCTLVFLTITALIVFFVTRIFPLAGENQIVELYNNED
mgnify:CR=1 FL=1